MACNSTRAMEDNILLKEGPEKLFPVWWHCCVPRRPWPTFVVEVCVMPVLLYDCENWIVSKKLLRQLELF